MKRDPFEPSATGRGLYDQRGYLLVDSLFSREEVRTICASVPEVMQERSERTVLEASQRTVRSVYGIHQHHPTFERLAKHPRLIDWAKRLLGGDVYVYQSKLNTKAAVEGDLWPWHQDYVYWLREDAMPRPCALTVMVLLDDVTEFNGPLLVIPGSHQDGVLPYDVCEGPPPSYGRAPAWLPHVVARLKYTLAKDTFVRLARERGLVSPKARAGSALFFDCNLAHASPPNLSACDRTIALITYNRVDNAPPGSGLQRPAFLVSRDNSPVVPVDDGIFGTA
jgi:ectoine hydroxylase